jgi:hypothetical protein
MRLACPTQEQGWDLSVSPSYSFFASEVTFGQGKLLVERPGSGRK